MKTFNPIDWYWIVGSDTGRVYATSDVNDFIAADDAIYLEWLEDGTAPTHIDTEFNLGAALAAYYPNLRPLPAGVLDGYIDAIAGGVLTDEAFAVLFNHENRLRSQEGLPPLQLGQARQVFRRHVRRAPPPPLATAEGVERLGDDE